MKRERKKQGKLEYSVESLIKQNLNINYLENRKVETRNYPVSELKLNILSRYSNANGDIQRQDTDDYKRIQLSYIHYLH